jgi:hypothetical protein
MALKTRKAIQIQLAILQDLNQIFLELEKPVRPFVSNNETKEDRDGHAYIVVKKDDFEDYLVLLIKEYEHDIFNVKHPIVSVGFLFENFEVNELSHLHNADDYYFWKRDVLKEKIKKVLEQDVLRERIKKVF